MQALRLNEVLTRVVAWHNRHPLARRIHASQVHSVGEVVLPFASAQPAPPAPVPGAGAAPPLPALQELLAPQPDSDPALPALAGAGPYPDAAADAADGRLEDAAGPAHTPAAEAPEAAPPPTAEEQADELFGGGDGEPAAAAATDDDGSHPRLAGNDADPFADPLADPLADPSADPFADPAPPTADAAADAAPAGAPADPEDDPFADPAPQPAPAVAADATDDAAQADDDGPEVLIEVPGDEPGQTDSARPAEASADDPWADPAAADAASAELAAAFAAVADEPTPGTAGPGTAPQAEADDGPGPPARPDAAAAEAGHLQADAAAPVVGAAEAQPGPTPGAPPAASPANAHPAAAASTLAAPAHRPGLWARLLAALAAAWPGRRAASATAATLPRLQATFSRDFIWPMRPGHVARWARRHGSLQPLAPADWPQRVIDTDAALMARARQRLLVHDLPVHVLTAAIGVGDRRIRVLIDAQGRIIGPRAYSPPRLATAASLLALVLVGSGGAWLPRGGMLNAQETAAVVALAASAAAQAASAAALAATAASAAESVWRAQMAEAAAQPDSTPAGEAGAAASPGHTDASAGGHATAAAEGAGTGTDAGKDAAAADGPHGAQAPHAAAASGHGAAEPGASAAARPPGATPAADGAGPLPRLAALISDADKQAARDQARALRDASAAPAPGAQGGPREPGPVYAVVTLATLERDSAARSLALMRASRSRLSGTAPAHGELMRQGAEWRAAWWPFDNQADAERARVMLIARGLKAEVVEF